MENEKGFEFPKRIALLGDLAELAKVEQGIATYVLENSELSFEATERMMKWLRNVGYFEEVGR